MAGCERMHEGLVAPMVGELGDRCGRVGNAPQRGASRNWKMIMFQIDTNQLKPANYDMIKSARMNQIVMSC